MQVVASKKKPLEQALAQIKSVSPGRFAAGNFEGAITNRKLVSNLLQEAKEAEKKKKGFLPRQDLSNILNALQNTQRQDLERRRECGDLSEDLLGVVRTIDVFPKFNVCFHTKGSLLLMAELSEANRLVLSQDATGGQFDVPNTTKEGKFQHIQVTMQASECFLTKEDGDKFSSCLFRPFKFAERVSDSNTGNDIAAWISQLREECMSVTATSLKRTIDPCPQVVKFDCALEFVNGNVSGFRRDGQVDTGKMLNNVVILVLLHHESVTQNASDPSLVKESAVRAFSAIKSVSPFLVKQCSSHVFLAQKDHRKRMRNQPIEMRLRKEQFDQINLHIASEVPFLSRVVDVVTRLSIVVSIFERKEIPCEVFTIDSACQHFHDRSAGEAIAKTMATLILRKRQHPSCPSTRVISVSVWNRNWGALGKESAISISRVTSWQEEWCSEWSQSCRWRFPICSKWTRKRERALFALFLCFPALRRMQVELSLLLLSW